MKHENFEKKVDRPQCTVHPPFLAMNLTAKQNWLEKVEVGKGGEIGIFQQYAIFISMKLTTAKVGTPIQSPSPPPLAPQRRTSP